MRCKKHITDLSSNIGVCASCLRERLFVIVAVQSQEDHRRTNNINSNSSPLMFHRSVSPYISRRKSDSCSAVDNGLPHRHQEIRFQRFFSTPQVGLGSKIIVDQKKKSGLGFSLFGNFFSSKSEKIDSGTGTGSRSWFGTLFSGRRRKKTRTSSINDSSNKGQRRICRKADKGISPTRHSDEEDDGHWRDTPKRTPAWIMPEKRGHSRDASGLGFCLSPLIRGSPSGNWNQKGIPSEIIVSGGVRVVR